MKRIAALLLLPALGGCIFGSGAASRVEKVPEDLLRPKLVAPKVSDRYAYGDVSKLRPGQWASYREGERTFTIAAVAAEGDRLWVEVIEEGDPRQVSARLVDRDGVVHKAFYGEISKDGRKSTVEPQRLEQYAAPPPAKLTESGRETGEESVRIGDRDLKAKRVSVRLEDLEGRLVQELTLWHPDVPPVYSGSEAGGLVRRKVGASTLDLTGFGTDAKPLLDLPR